MKKLTILLLTLTQITLYSQQGFKWQGIAKDASGSPVTQPVTLTFTILENNVAVYSETHAPITPVEGQLTATVGVGSPTQGVFADIDWGAGSLSLNVKMAIGNAAPMDMGTSQILPVPIALYAANSGGDGAWTLSNGDVYRETGKVGIKTNNPLYDFQIGEGTVTSLAYEQINSSPNAGIFRFGDNTGWKVHFGRMRDNYQSPLLNYGTTGNFLTIVDNGKIGIGITDPKSALSIHGDLHLEGSKRIYFQGGTTDPNYFVESYVVPGSAALRMKGFGGVTLATKDGDVLTVENNATIVNHGEGYQSPDISDITDNWKYGLIIHNTTNNKAWTIRTTNDLFSNGNLTFYRHTPNEGSGGYAAASIGPNGSWNQPSDIRLKTNISSLSPVLVDILNLEPKRYNYNYPGNSSNEKKSIGFLAQDVQSKFPELVESYGQDDKSFLALDYSGFSVLAIKAIQEQQVIIEQLQKTVDQLANQVEYLSKK